MALSDPLRLRLLDSLEKAGWLRRDDFLVAPHETMWLPIAQPWHDDGLKEFQSRMVGRHQRLVKMGNQNAAADAAALVRVLGEMFPDNEIR